MPSEYSPFSRDPLIIIVSGTRFLLPWRPAAVWVAAMAQPEGLASRLAEPEDRDRLADLVMERPDGLAGLKQESLRILSEATGRKWWEGARLLNTSAGGEVLGRLVLSGADAWSRSVGEWTAAVYALCVKGRDEKERLRFDFSLSLPPADYEDEWDDGVDPDDAAAMIAQMTGKR